jgi:hypothetical protein
MRYEGWTEGEKKENSTPNLLSELLRYGSYPCILIIRYRVPGSVICSSIAIASHGGWGAIPHGQHRREYGEEMALGFIGLMLQTACWLAAPIADVLIAQATVWFE